MAAEQVFGWLARPERLKKVPVVDGLARRCASQEGNALAVCTLLGLADDERVALLARSLVTWQWPDGGWSCDQRASDRRSSFHESFAPAWGLYEYARATGDEAAGEAAGVRYSAESGVKFARRAVAWHGAIARAAVAGPSDRRPPRRVSSAGFAPLPSA
jgi:hypothetical protein